MRTCAGCGRENPPDARFCNGCAAPLGPQAVSPEQLKTITVLFADVTGSTALGERLEPETLRRVMERYFELARRVIERHGGTVEKFIGDAVMAVFGVPVLHEDDALRALRAAADLRSELPELNTELERDHDTTLQLRTGVNTGEAATATDEWLASGDAVNVAARFEQAAAPGEVLLGEATLRLVRGAVVVEDLEPLELRGKGEPVPAYRLIEVIAGAETPVRQLGAPMVGRARQVAMLEHAFANVVQERSCSLFTLLGVAGVGKSRLVAEFLSGLDATVLRGRCLSYGEGITYWPVAEVIKQLLRLEPDDGSWIPRAEDEAATTAIGALLGQANLASTSSEIAWAARKLFERAAAQRPLVVVFDDIHWGEQTFLDLIEHVTDLSRDAPILLLCMARPELLERRSTWGGGKLNATTVLLEPLNSDEAGELIERLLPADASSGLRDHVREAAAGNPLFLEEFAAAVGVSGSAVSVPPTIQALLAARLDQLEVGERRVLECGSVEGQSFHRGVVQALRPDEAGVHANLVTLVRKDLVRPDRATFSGDDAYRFRHLLIRDAAYEGLPKSVRADLHERFARWLDECAGDLIERDEIAGFHLEQAYRYRCDLGPIDGATRALADSAAQRLETAGLRALDRRDSGAAANLLERASYLMSPDRPNISLELNVVWALFEGARQTDAVARAQAASSRAAAAGDVIGELRAELARVMVLSRLEPEGKMADLGALIDRSRPVFEQAGDDAALASLWYATGSFEFHRGRIGAATDAVLRGLEHAERAGEQYLVRHCGSSVAGGMVFGPTPVSEALAWLEAHASRENEWPDPLIEVYRARLLSSIGRFDEAREIHRSAASYMADRGMKHLFLHTGEVSGAIEWDAGDFAKGEQAQRQLCSGLEEIGDWNCWSYRACWLAQLIYHQGRFEEAETWAKASSEAADSNASSTQLVSRLVLAKVEARRGRIDDARKLVAEALAIVGDMQSLYDQGLAALDVAEVLWLAGDRAPAIEQAERAVAIYEAKGATAYVERALLLRDMVGKPFS